MYTIFKFNLIYTLLSNHHSVRLHVLGNKMPSGFSIVKLTEEINESIQTAAKVLERGGIIALPTDTLYGLAVDATNSEAIKALYRVKQRDLQKPLAICVHEVSEIKKWGVTDDLPYGLLNKLLPGPVTVLLNRTPALNSNLNPEVLQVGVRVVPGNTDKSFVSSVASVLGKPLALTSANPSSLPSSISVNEFKVLWPLIEVIFDGGTIDNESRDGSTIVDLSVKGKYRIIRPGIAFKSVVSQLHKFGLVE